MTLCVCVHSRPCKCECCESLWTPIIQVFSVLPLSAAPAQHEPLGRWTSLQLLLPPQLLLLQVKSHLSSTDALGSGVWLERTCQWQEGGCVCPSSTSPSSFRRLDNTKMVMGWSAWCHRGDVIFMYSLWLIPIGVWTEGLCIQGPHHHCLKQLSSLLIHLSLTLSFSQLINANMQTTLHQWPYHKLRI